MSDFDSLNFHLSFSNFNPEQVQVEETINAVFIVDVSPSITTYAKSLNEAFNDFVATMQKSHVAERLMVSVINFSENIDVQTGFQPIKQIPTMQFKPTGIGTALYDAFAQGLKMALDYRNNLEASGVLAKTLLFVITDGLDNSSSARAETVKKELEKVLSEEQNAFSFTTVLFGVGNAKGFEDAQQKMGIEHLARVGTTGEEIEK